MTCWVVSPSKLTVQEVLGDASIIHMMQMFKPVQVMLTEQKVYAEGNCCPGHYLGDYRDPKKTGGGNSPASSLV